MTKKRGLKSERYKCPDCRSYFRSQHGFNIHQGRSHNGNHRRFRTKVNGSWIYHGAERPW